MRSWLLVELQIALPCSLYGKDCEKLSKLHHMSGSSWLSGCQILTEGRSLWPGALVEAALIGDKLEEPPRFHLSNYSNCMQRHELHRSHSWRNYREELQNLVKDSIQRSFDDQRASSSRSMEFHATIGFNLSPACDVTGQKRKQSVKMKSPNLIARLMGLEEVPEVTAAARTIFQVDPTRRMKKGRVVDSGNQSDSSCTSSKEQSSKISHLVEGYESLRKDATSLKKRKPAASLSHTHGQERKEAANSIKRTEWGQKPKPSRANYRSKKEAKFTETQMLQPKNASASSDVPAKKLTSAKNNVLKNNVIHQRRSMSRNSTNPSEEKKATGARRVTEVKKDLGETTARSKKNNVFTMNNSHTAAEPPPKPKSLNSKSSINEKTRRKQRIICEVMPKASKHFVNQLSCTTKRTSKVEHLEGLLLSSQSFLLQAYELSLDPQTRPIHYGKTEPKEANNNESKLYLACAKELILRRTFHLQFSIRPLLLKCSWRAQELPPLDQIVREICKGVRRLANYSEVGDDVDSRDSLYVKLERDIKCKDLMLSAMWDMGWRKGICMEEADDVVDQIEKQIMSAIIDEITLVLVN